MSIERLGVEPSLLPPDSEGRIDALHDEVDRYFDGMVERNLMPGPDEDTVIRTKDILTSGVVVAGLLRHPRMESVRGLERGLIGSNIEVGHISCVDGRETFNLRSLHSHSVRAPGAILRSRTREDGRRVPVSTALSAAVRAQIQTAGEVLEIVSPHFHCGEMTGRINAGLVPFGIDPMVANIDEIRTHTVGALTTVVNDQRKAMGLAELPRVVLVARHNMATNGYHFLDDCGNQLANTGDAVRNHSDSINSESGIEPGAMVEDFDQLGRLIDLHEKVYQVTRSMYSISGLRDMIENLYPDLSEKQRVAFVFKFFRAMAYSYVNGKAWNVDNERMPYTHHEEEFGLVTTGNPSHHVEQHFITTAPDVPTALLDARKMVVLSSSIHGVERPFILMVATPGEADVSQSALGANSALMVAMYTDEFLGQAIKGGRVIPVPKIVDTRLRAPLTINTSVSMDL